MRFLLPLSLACLTAGSLSAIRTEVVQQGGFSDFFQGERENISLSSDGVLSLAPALQEVADLSETIVWTGQYDAEGRLLLGTANDGKVLRVDSEGEVTTLFDSDELMARAMTLGLDGELFVGTSPQGRVYRIVEEGRPEVVFDPDDDYIWGMLTDSEGRLYIATGRSARIYRIPPDFKPGDEPEIFFEAGHDHVINMRWEDEDTLLVGASGPGVLYRIDAEGEATALYNAQQSEIQSILPYSDDSLIVSTFGQSPVQNNFSGSNNNDDESDLYPYRVVVTANAGDGGSASSGGSSASGFGALYRLDDRGFHHLIWRTPGGGIFALQPYQNGFLAGTNDNGRIFWLENADRWTLLQQAPRGGDVTLFMPGYTSDDPLVLTSNPAVLYRLEASPAEGGTFTSIVLEAGQIAQWGKLHLTGEGLDRLVVETRTGNTKEPDKHWSPWTALADDQRVTSPPGRFLQYRIDFPASASEARLLQSKVYYQLANAAPRVSQVRGVPVGLELIARQNQNTDIQFPRLFQRNPLQSEGEPQQRSILRQQGQEGLFTLVWQAEDPNADPLHFTVSLQDFSEETWTLLANELEQPVYTFNTRGLKEGWYRFRVTADDSPGNPQGEGMTGSRISAPYLIDNSPPLLEEEMIEIGTDSASIRLRAFDEFSVINRALYALNGQPQQNLLPVDRLYDGQEEHFDLQLSNLESGQHSLLVEVFDEQGRRGVLALSFNIE